MDGAGDGNPGNTHRRVYCVAICAEVNRPCMNMLPKDGSPFLHMPPLYKTRPQMLSQKTKSFRIFSIPGFHVHVEGTVTTSVFVRIDF